MTPRRCAGSSRQHHGLERIREKEQALRLDARHASLHALVGRSLAQQVAHTAIRKSMRGMIACRTYARATGVGSAISWRSRR